MIESQFQLKQSRQFHSNAPSIQITLYLKSLCTYCTLQLYIVKNSKFKEEQGSPKRL